MTATIDVSSIDQPLIVITRMFDAARALVWTAITDPKNVAQWYGGPGFTNPVCEMDLRPGGAPIFSSIFFGVYFGILAWVGLYLRDERLRSLIPLRREGVHACTPVE